MGEMNEVTRISENFKEELGIFLLDIQTARILNESAFCRIETNSQEIAKQLKKHPLVPKSVLHEMRTAIKILRAEAPYMPEKKQVMNNMADRLEMTFDLILLGEDHGDRSSGTPRIL